MWMKLRSLSVLVLVAPYAAAEEPLPAGAIVRLGSTKWRPGGQTRYLVLSADGKRLFSWNSGSYAEAALTEWDVASGRALRRVELPGAQLLQWQRLADGRGVAVVKADKGPYVWEFTDPKAPRPPVTPPPKVGGMPAAGFERRSDAPVPASFLASPDGKYLYVGFAASSGREQPIQRFDLVMHRYLNEQRSETTLATQPGSCRGLLASPDGRTLVSLSPVSTPGQTREVLAVVRDAADGTERRRFTLPAPLVAGDRWAGAVSERHIALGCGDDQALLSISRLDDGTERRIETGHIGERYSTGQQYSGVSAVAFSPDGNRVITGGRDGSIKVWDVATGKLVRAISDAFPIWVEELALSPDGRRVACGGMAGVIRHWDLTTGAELDAPPGPRGAIRGGALGRDNTAITVSADGMLHEWDLKSGALKRGWPIGKSVSHLPFVSLTPDGRTAVTGGASNVSIWDVASGKRVSAPEWPADLPSHYATFAADGRSLLAFQDVGLGLLDWPSGKLRRWFAPKAPADHGVSVTGGSLSPDGRQVAIAAGLTRRLNPQSRTPGNVGSVLDLFDAATDERLHRAVDGSSSTSHPIFATPDDLVFAGGQVLHEVGGAAVDLPSNRIHVLDPLTARLRCSLDLPPPTRMYWSPGAVTVSPDGRSLYCSGSDGIIHLYEIATGKLRRSRPGHRGYVGALHCSADGQRLLSGSHDLTALLWDVSLAAAPNKDAKLSPEECWTALLDADAAKAYAAMARLAATPSEAVTLLRSHLKPATAAGPNTETLDRLVADLSADTFATREKATRDLDALGAPAADGLRARMLASPPEARQRIAKLLAKHDPPRPAPERLREIRALEFLEQINTHESRTLLADLAKGAATARLTRDAAASLRRIVR